MPSPIDTWPKAGHETNLLPGSSSPVHLLLDLTWTSLTSETLKMARPSRCGVSGKANTRLGGSWRFEEERQSDQYLNPTDNLIHDQ